MSKDSSALEQAIAMGQRFNGMVGTYAFVGDKEGYRQLLVLASLIDDISRHYEKSQDTMKVMVEDHRHLMVRAATNALRILQDLRGDKPVSEANNKELAEIEKVFAGMTEIERRDSQSQDDVDALVDQLQKAN